jgi:AraC family transcriptional activator of pobA
MSSTIPTYDLYGENQADRPDFWVHCETIEARSRGHRWEIGLHRHESFQQFLYIRKGDGDAVFAAETLALSPPCIISIPPGFSHGFRFSKDIDGLVVTLLSARLGLTAGTSRGHDGWLSIPRVTALRSQLDARYLEETFSRLHQEFRLRRSDSNELMEAYLKSAILILRRQMSDDSDHGSADTKRARLDALNNLIGQHFRQQVSTKAYAAMLNLSPTHLNRVVRETAGVTVHDLIMNRVLEEARRALVLTPASIQSIAEQIGFSDANYFARCFRKRTGRTPKQYRQEERQRLRGVGSDDLVRSRHNPLGDNSCGRRGINPGSDALIGAVALPNRNEAGC